MSREYLAPRLLPLVPKSYVPKTFFKLSLIPFLCEAGLNFLPFGCAQGKTLLFPSFFVYFAPLWFYIIQMLVDLILQHQKGDAGSKHSNVNEE